jgi:signal transduction histidine kinase
MPHTPAPTDAPWPRLKAAGVRAFHAYATWLVGIGWWRFVLLALLLLIGTSMLQELPPFDWTLSERTETVTRPSAKADRAAHRVTVQIDTGESAAASAPAASAASAAGVSIRIALPPGAQSDAVREAVAQARQAIEEAVDEGHDTSAAGKPRTRVVRVSLGDRLMQVVMLFILASIIIKITYKGRLQAEVKAARATQTAEAEALKRQVVEARMAAMQAQVEPHFLFNTLASIDHLIETDPPRASAMQKNLIALLRASMPTLREASVGGLRTLGSELAVVTPYLDILKMRMEDRLHTVTEVPEGLRSAEFPPMVLQSLVENAIKHGLEPKPEGGSLSVRAEIVHGQLAVSVADTGLGFGQAATAGTGIGLSNIRERLHLLYGGKASLTVAANTPSGTRVTVAVPYAVRTEAGEAANREGTR